MKIIVAIALFQVFSIQIIGQKTSQLYLANEFRNAYLNETRSWDGKPGRNYFQNSVDYMIQAEFFPESKVLAGKEIISFKNNSPVNLNELYINLYQNLYKKGSETDFDLDPANLHDGVVIKSININGKKIKTEDLQYESTIMLVPLKKAIMAGSLTKIEIEWESRIPVTPQARTGTYYENNYFIAYWYPKICVFDDILAWNALPGYTGSAEFYNEYGDFDVEITVPSDYNVWSTGILQNENEIFTDKYLKRIKQSKISDEFVSIIGNKDRKDNHINRPGEKHVWKFKIAKAPDFAFAVSASYYWDATSVKVGNRRVFVNSVYNKQNKNFSSVIEIAAKSIDFFSKKVPGIEFPYPQITIFNGQVAGMEFPGMANIAEYDNMYNTIEYTAHEIAHSYLPFYVGCNEQKYAWMDEGIITFLTDLAVQEISKDSTFIPFQWFIKDFNENTGALNYEAPLMTVSQNLGHSYTHANYGRAPTAFYLLYDYLGKEKFFEAISVFIDNWKGKHPIPNDLFITFNNISNEDLAWFWKPWFFELGYPDIGISSVELKTDSANIIVENTGNFPVPLKIKVTYKNGNTQNISEAITVWKSSNKYQINVSSKNIQEIIIDNLVPDNFSNNNVWTLPHQIEKYDLSDYIGNFGPRHIIIQDGELYYFRDGSPHGKMKMIAINDDCFRFNELDYFRLGIIRKDNKIVAIEGLYSDNRLTDDISKRSK